MGHWFEGMDEQCLSGIWSQDIAHGLAWRLEKSYSHDRKRPDHRSPSWSWQSVYGALTFPEKLISDVSLSRKSSRRDAIQDSSSKNRSSRRDAIYDLSSASKQFTGPDAISNLEDLGACIQLVGHCVQMLALPCSECSVLLDRKFDEALIPRLREFLILLLGFEDSKAHCLILVPEHSKYRRLGVLTCSKTAYALHMPSGGYREIYVS